MLKPFQQNLYSQSIPLIFETISFSLIGLPFFCLSASLIAIWSVVTGARIPITPFIPLFAIHVLLFLLSLIPFFSIVLVLGYISPACLLHQLMTHSQGSTALESAFLLLFMFLLLSWPIGFPGPLRSLHPFSVHIYGRNLRSFFPPWIFQLCCQVCMHIRSTAYDKELYKKLYGVLPRMLKAWWPQHSNRFESSSANNVKCTNEFGSRHDPCFPCNNPGFSSATSQCMTVAVPCLGTGRQRHACLLSNSPSTVARMGSVVESRSHWYSTFLIK